MDMMKAILEIEKKAQAVEASVEKERAELLKATDEKIADFKEKAIAQSNEKIAAKEAAIEKERKAEEARLRERSETEKASLEAMYSENKDKWVKEISEKIKNSEAAI